jgi:hypothetical protein
VESAKHEMHNYRWTTMTRQRVHRPAEANQERPIRELLIPTFAVSFRAVFCMNAAASQKRFHGQGDGCAEAEGNSRGLAQSWGGPALPSRTGVSLRSSSGRAMANPQRRNASHITPTPPLRRRSTASRAISAVSSQIFAQQSGLASTSELAQSSVASASGLAEEAKWRAEVATASDARGQKASSLSHELFQSRVSESKAAASLFAAMSMPQAALVLSSSVVSDALCKSLPGLVHDARYAQAEASRSGLRASGTAHAAQLRRSRLAGRLLGAKLVTPGRSAAVTELNKRHDSDLCTAKARAARLRQAAKMSRKAKDLLRHRQSSLRASQGRKKKLQSDLKAASLRIGVPQRTGASRLLEDGPTTRARQALEQELLRRIQGHWQLRAEVLEEVSPTAVDDHVKAVAESRADPVSAAGLPKQQNQQSTTLLGTRQANSPLNTLLQRLEAISLRSRTSTQLDQQNPRHAEAEDDPLRTSVTESMLHKHSTHSDMASHAGTPLTPPVGSRLDPPQHASNHSGPAASSRLQRAAGSAASAGMDPDGDTVSSGRTHDGRYDYELDETGGEFAFAPSLPSSLERTGGLQSPTAATAIISGIDGQSTAAEQPRPASRSPGLPTAHRPHTSCAAHAPKALTRRASHTARGASGFGGSALRSRTSSASAFLPTDPSGLDRARHSPPQQEGPLKQRRSSPQGALNMRLAPVAGCTSPQQGSVSPGVHSGRAAHAATSRATSRATSATRHRDAGHASAELKRLRLAGGLVPWAEFQRREASPDSSQAADGAPRASQARPGSVGAAADAGLPPHPDGEGPMRLVPPGSPLRRVVAATALRALAMHSAGTRGSARPGAGPASREGGGSIRLAGGPAAVALPGPGRSGAHAMHARLDAIRSLQGPYGKSLDASRAAMLSSVVTIEAALPRLAAGATPVTDEHLLQQLRQRRAAAERDTPARRTNHDSALPHRDVHRNVVLAGSRRPDQSTGEALHKSLTGRDSLPEAALEASADAAGISATTASTPPAPTASSLSNGAIKHGPAESPPQKPVRVPPGLSQRAPPRHGIQQRGGGGVPRQTQSVRRAMALQEATAMGTQPAPTTERASPSTAAPPSTNGTGRAAMVLEASYLPQAPPVPQRGVPSPPAARFTYARHTQRPRARASAVAAANRRAVDAPISSTNRRNGRSPSRC